AHLAELDVFDLLLVEQPLAHDDLVDHSRLQAEIRSPVCLDESIAHPRHAKQAIALGSCRFVNVKPGRVGGLTNAVTIHDLCREAGLPCWVGGMLESATGVALCIALAMLDNFTYPADIFPSSKFYVEDLSDPPVELVRNEAGEPSVRAFDRLPEPVPDRLRRCTVQHALLR
ncbi:MAG TPA: o-succinylbenzoate synthase, partial [Planctomycetaceae bacterium]|nr:o-succinylbenzoate synthase [Planctomycetaceae bacterium]